MISTLRESTAHVFVDSIDAPALNELDAHHLLRVLRVKPRDAVTISNGRGKWCSCVVAADSVIEVTSEVFTDSAPSWPLTVAFSVVKGDRPEWTVQKLTEIGIDEIILLAATARFMAHRFPALVASISKLSSTKKELHLLGLFHIKI